MTASDQSSQGIECALCGETFESWGVRMAHVERGKCPEVDSEEDKFRADLAELVDELAETGDGA